VAATLGYADGEVMSFDEYFFLIKRIKAATPLPLSVDLEGGYGRTVDEIVSNIKRLHEIGIVGINIEDSAIENGSRKIAEGRSFAEKLKQISNGLTSNKVKIFINVRCDAFLLRLQNARQEALSRIKLYESQGINGVFLPCITEIEDIKAAVGATQLPLNVMCMPDLPDFQILESAGVKRISMGNFANINLYGQLEKTSRRILTDKNFSALFN